MSRLISIPHFNCCGRLKSKLWVVKTFYRSSGSSWKENSNKYFFKYFLALLKRKAQCKMYFLKGNFAEVLE